MSKNTPDGHESIEARTRRALEEALSVVTLDGTPVNDPETSVVQVVSHSGNGYTVDVERFRCGCPDSKHRDPAGGCKHVRRARAVLGLDPIDSQVLGAVDVDENLGVNAPGPVVATPDGGSEVV